MYDNGKRRKKNVSIKAAVKKAAGFLLLALVIILVDTVFTSCSKQEEMVITESGTIAETKAAAGDLVAADSDEDLSEEKKTEVSKGSESIGAAGLVSAGSESRTEGESAPQGEDISCADTSKICVYVCGAVISEGVYYLPLGARVYEAVEAAKGFADDADTRAVNQAQVLTDGVQLIIPTKEETAGENGASYGIVSGESTERGSSTAKESGGTGLVDINTADAETLKTLPGIGDVKAAAIISYRETNGKFGSIEEIKNVPGIKEAGFEKIKDKISCSP